MHLSQWHEMLMVAIPVILGVGSSAMATESRPPMAAGLPRVIDLRPDRSASLTSGFPWVVQDRVFLTGDRISIVQPGMRPQTLFREGGSVFGEPTSRWALAVVRDTLWKIELTGRVIPIHEVPSRSFNEVFVYLGDYQGRSLYWTSVAGMGAQIFAYDGAVSRALTPVKVLGQKTVARAGDRLFFWEQEDQWTLYTFDLGSGVRTRLTKSTIPAFSIPPVVQAVNGGVVFDSSSRSDHRRSVWRSDGTEEGTFEISALQPEQHVFGGGTCGTCTRPIDWHSAVFAGSENITTVLARDAAGLLGLYATDGSTAGTFSVQQAPADSNGVHFWFVTPPGDRVWLQWNQNGDAPLIHVDLRTRRQTGFSITGKVSRIEPFRQGVFVRNSSGTWFANPKTSELIEISKALANQETRLLEATDAGNTALIVTRTSASLTAPSTIWSSDGTLAGTTVVEQGPPVRWLAAYDATGVAGRGDGSITEISLNTQMARTLPPVLVAESSNPRITGGGDSLVTHHSQLDDETLEIFTNAGPEPISAFRASTLSHVANVGDSVYFADRIGPDEGVDLIYWQPDQQPIVIANFNAPAYGFARDSLLVSDRQLDQFGDPSSAATYCVRGQVHELILNEASEFQFSYFSGRRIPAPGWMDLTLFVAEVEGGFEVWATDCTQQGTRRLFTGEHVGPSYLCCIETIQVRGEVIYYSLLEGEVYSWTEGSGSVLLSDRRVGDEHESFPLGQGFVMFDDGDQPSFLYLDQAGLHDFEYDFGEEAGLARSFAPREPVVLDENRILFSASLPGFGRELFLAQAPMPGQGQAPRIRMLRDIFPGGSSSSPTDLRHIGDYVLFSASTPGHGEEVWLTDGTPEGTYELFDVQPGGVSSSPRDFTQSGERFFFSAFTTDTGRELWWAPLDTLDDPLNQDCRSSSQSLCLLDRFRVDVTFLDPRTGSQKSATVTTPGLGSAESGAFWFFTGDNVELSVKLLDATTVNGHAWFFSGPLSDVAYTVTLTDSATGNTTTYYSEAGRSCGIVDTTALPTARPAASTAAERPLPAPPPAPHTSNATIAAEQPESEAPTSCADPRALCLHDDRFLATVRFVDPRTGENRLGKARRHSERAGYFWFFRPDNLEVSLKILDGETFNGHFWLLSNGLTGLAYSLEVTDREVGTSRAWNVATNDTCAVIDIEAF